MLLKYLPAIITALAPIVAFALNFWLSKRKAEKDEFKELYEDMKEQRDYYMKLYKDSERRQK